LEIQTERRGLFAQNHKYRARSLLSGEAGHHNIWGKKKRKPKRRKKLNSRSRKREDGRVFFARLPEIPHRTVETTGRWENEVFLAFGVPGGKGGREHLNRNV